MSKPPSRATLTRVAGLPACAGGDLDVAAIGSTHLLETLRASGLVVHQVACSFVTAQLQAWPPRYLVVEEKFVRTSRWSRWVDSFGSARGSLREAALVSHALHARVVVLTDPDASPELSLRHAQYLPNLRTSDELSESEYPDRALSVLAAVAASTSTGGDRT